MAQIDTIAFIFLVSLSVCSLAAATDDRESINGHGLVSGLLHSFAHSGNPPSNNHQGWSNSGSHQNIGHKWSGYGYAQGSWNKYGYHNSHHGNSGYSSYGNNGGSSYSNIHGSGSSYGSNYASQPSPGYGIGAGISPSNLCSLADNEQSQLAGLMMSAATTPAFPAGLVSALMDANAGGCLDDLTTTMGQAIIAGGAPVATAVAQALAVASSNGMGSAQGQVVAKATAVAICKGGMTATAIARSWSEAVTISSQGCEVLTEAFAQAVATCRNGASMSKSFATSFTIPLGYCHSN